MGSTPDLRSYKNEGGSDDYGKKEEQERKHYIDNLRSLTILLLFPVHTFMIWNDFGVGFYIWQGENRLLSTIIVLINPWFMPLLFVLAGMSARYALKKRTNKEFIIQRVNKLLVPFISGIIIHVPVLTMYAGKFRGCDRGVLDSWKYFFTNYTDFSGYDGAFTPGHLWFILFLFIISMAALIMFHFAPYEKAAPIVGRLPVIGILLLFIPIWLMYYLGNIGGYSIGKNLALYLIGYYLLSNDFVMERLKKKIKWLAALCAAATAASAVIYYRFAYYGDLWVNFIGWITILFLLAAGSKYMNRKTGFTKYFNGASYPVYILHYSILVVLAYYLLQISDVLLIQALLICIGSFVLTVAAYHIIRHLPVVRRVIGISGKNSKNS